MSRQRPHLILTILALLAVPAVAQHEGVHWQHDVESAKATARQTGKLVLVHFWTPNCGPCLMLDQNVFNQPGVAGAIESQFVPVKLNANENPATATGFGITRVPTDVILTADGQVVGKLISPPTPAAYVAEVSQVATQHTTQLGYSFGKAAEAAPAPPLNAAYANLQIAPNTPPALEAQQAAAPNDRYAMPPSVGTGTAVNAAAPAGLGAPHSAQSPSYDPWATTVTTAPTIAAPNTTAAPSPYDQYASVATSTISTATPNVVAPTPTAVAPTPPAQMANPYVSPSPTSTPPTAAPASDASARRLPPNAPPLGFEGYCPVSMRNHWKWVPGDPRWGIVHRGRTYWFAGQEEQQQFWADPDRFSPALSGMDPVLVIDHQQQVPGKREHSIDYDNLFYMFASEATLQQFTANPERYAASVRQAMGISRGRLVR